MAVLMYSVDLYMDFSGGIDIVIGAAQMFGITMDENFRQPFFSKSIGEFWRRWHITLGTWMKDYIFYPMSLSKGMNKLSKWGKKHLGNHLGRTLPICFANLVIFFIVGIWHGAEVRYIAYGLYNGIIIAFSNLCEPIYKKGLEKFHINGDGRGWKIFKIIRTFILVNIGWIFDCCELGMRTAVKMMTANAKAFTHAASVLGVFVVGALISNYGGGTKLGISIANGEGDPIVIQNYLNMILPCLIAFAFTMMCYVLIKKKNWTPVKCIALFLVIGIVGAAFGIWAGSYTPLVPVPWSVVA